MPVKGLPGAALKTLRARVLGSRAMTTLAALPADSVITVWTYKDGLLAKMAHDLCIRATRLRADVTLEARRFTVDVAVPVRGLRVQGQVKDGRVMTLGEKDHQKIEDNLAGKDVLDANRYPDVRFAGEGLVPESGAGPLRVEGRLTIHGNAQPLTLDCELREVRDRWVVVGEARLRQTAFGVTPYSALFGALKVQDEVRVSWELAYQRPG